MVKYFYNGMGSMNTELKRNTCLVWAWFETINHCTILWKKMSRILWINVWWQKKIALSYHTALSKKLVNDIWLFLLSLVKKFEISIKMEQSKSFFIAT